MPCPKHIINNGQNHRPKRPHHTVIHIVHRNRQLRRPVAKEDDNDDVNNRIGIDNDAPDAGDTERTPHQLGAGDVDHGVVALVVVGDGAGGTPPEEEDGDDQVGGVETGDGHGDDVVEGNAGADVDETEETADGHGEEDGVSGEEGAVGDLGWC